MRSAVVNLLALASTAYAYTPSAAGTKSGCYWNTDAGPFNTRFGHDFTADLYGSVDSLVPSTYTVNAGVNPLARRFDLVNIGLDAKEQALTLTVPGGQTDGPISSAQLTTSFNDILYASIRTVAKISNVPGTTHGFIFYANDTQEVDFAWLTADVSKAWLTNEQVSYGSPYSTYSVGAPADASSAYHEYRLDWLPGVSKFYIDGVLVQTITDNSPSTPGRTDKNSAAIWNNWSNGNAWAQGPPLADSVLRIRSIDAYFNRTSVADNINANPSSCPAVVVSSSSSSIAPSSTSVSSSSSSVISSSSMSSSSSSLSSTPVVSSSTKSSSSSVASTSSSASASSVASTLSSSSSSSSVASTTSSSSTSVVAPAGTAPATVSFTTVTTAWTGLSTSTRTVVSGLVATVYVQTPAAKGQVVSTSSSIKASYTTITTHSGTASSIGYITTTPKLAGATTTVTIVYPTPVTSCGNQGINFAAYSNKYTGGQATLGYPSFIPESYKKTLPSFNADTSYIAESNDQYGTWINLYGYPFVDGTNLVLDHTFYLFASQTGYYSLNIPYTDDIQFVWIGNNAVTGWNRANADIIQFWSSQIATQTPQTLAYYLTVGSYLPIRVMWANGGGQGDLRFNIYAPDGSSVLSSNAGQNSGVSSVDIVQNPCNSALGAQFPVWGKET
ncbi:concanavalin A-like lectin/glucanase [Aureobasidium subglaciale]|nr:concanavalin A-like lectin/glucanase [Aureobasidium subglaciale]